MTSPSEKPFSVRTQQAATKGWRGVSYHETLQEALAATEATQDMVWAVFFKGWKLTACNESVTPEQLAVRVEKLTRGKWFVRSYTCEWSTSHNFEEFSSKRSAERNARELRKQNPHSHAKVVFREPVTFANCFLRSLDS